MDEFMTDGWRFAQVKRETKAQHVLALLDGDTLERTNDEARITKDSKKEIGRLRWWRYVSLEELRDLRDRRIKEQETKAAIRRAQEEQRAKDEAEAMEIVKSGTFEDVDTRFGIRSWMGLVKGERVVMVYSRNEKNVELTGACWAIRGAGYMEPRSWQFDSSIRGDTVFPKGEEPFEPYNIKLSDEEALANYIARIIRWGY